MNNLYSVWSSVVAVAFNLMWLVKLSLYLLWFVFIRLFFLNFNVHGLYNAAAADMMSSAETVNTALTVAKYCKI